MTSLGEICEFKYGSSLPEKVRIKGNIPVYGSNGQVGWHNKPLIKGPCIVIGRKGSCGEVNVCKGDCWPIDTTYYIAKISDRVDFDWFVYQLKILGLQQLNKAAAVPGLNRGDAYRKTFPLPSLPEQKRIAAILDQAHDLKEKRKQTIAKLDQLVQSVFIDMFGDPVENPKGWRKMQLCKIAEIKRGKFTVRPRNDPKYYGGNIPFIQTGDVVKSNTYIVKHEQTLNEMGLKVSKLFDVGTIAITIAANIGETAILTYPMCFPDSIIGINVDPAVLVPEFTEMQLRFFKKQLLSEATQFAQKNINLTNINPLEIIIPPIGKQEAFNAFVSEIFEVKSKNEKQLDEILKLISSLSQEFFG